jgi:hypothetical protein
MPRDFDLQAHAERGTRANKIGSPQYHNLNYRNLNYRRELPFAAAIAARVYRF